VTIFRLTRGRRSRREYGKAGTERDDGADLDAVPEQFDRAEYDEQSYSEPFATRGIEALKRFEDFRLALRFDADSGIVDVDADMRIQLATADEDASAGLCILYGIAHQIPQDAIEQQRVTEHATFCRTDTQVNSVLKGFIFIFVAQLPEQRRKLDGGDFHRFGILIEAKRADQVIKLLGQRGDSPFAPLQPRLTRPGMDTRSQPLIGATNDLQRLSEIMPRNAEKRRLKIAGALQLQYPGVDFRCLEIREAGHLDAPFYAPEM
jgi:hypothetical protein